MALDILTAMRLITRKNASLALSVVVETLIVYNCRVIEVLSCKAENVHPGKYVILKGAKGSNDVIIRDRSLLSQYVLLKEVTNGAMFSLVTYQQVYHFLQSNFGHLVRSLKNGKNNKVTHAFRYINIFPTDDEDSIKTILHHKSKRSNKYYKRKKKEL